MSDLHTYNVEEEDDRYVVYQRGPDGDGNLEEVEIANIPDDAAEELIKEVAEGMTLATLNVQTPTDVVSAELTVGDASVMQLGPITVAFEILGSNEPEP